jgi:hypothetical protein
MLLWCKSYIEAYSDYTRMVHAKMPLMTTILIEKATRDRLRALGKKGETYDQIIHRMMDYIETGDFPSQFNLSS